MTDHDSPLPDRAPHDASTEAHSDEQYATQTAEQAGPAVDQAPTDQARTDEAPADTPAPEDAAAVDTPDDAEALPVDESSASAAALPVDDSPVTGPLHTVEGGPDWHSRPSGALRATPVEAWSQAGTPGYHDPSVDAHTWFAGRPATGQVPSGQDAAAQPSGSAPRAGYPIFTGGYQRPGATGATPPAPAPGWHQTRTDLPPLGSAAAPSALATAEKPKRKKTTLIAATTVALALAAGFGGGLLGAHVGNNADVATAADSSLTQQSPAAPVSAVATSGATIESVAAKVLPSVVSILATSDSSGGEGSGVILTKDGLILTNGHVIEGATDLTVRFNDGTTAKATVVGSDTTDDLAVIKPEGVSNLTPAALGTSANLVVGQQVVAIGSPLGLSATVTSGIVSALNRPVRTASSEDQQQQQQPQDPFGGQGNGNGDQQSQSTTAASGTVLNAIQTDAAINPGNSGGPLVDMNGNVIGINSAIASLSDSSSSSQSGSIGVGFSIPIDQAHRVAQEIINTGKAQHAVLGASVRDNATSQTQMPTGALVASVIADGGAAKAGLKEGDVITKVGDLPVDSADALIAAIRSQTPGGTVKITYVRGSDTASVDVTLGATSS
jgi:putative serine protease PepD